MEALRAAPFAVALVHVSTLQPYKCCQVIIYAVVSNILEAPRGNSAVQQRAGLNRKCISVFSEK